MMEEHYCMWLSRVEGIGLKRFCLLMDTFGSAENIWHAKRESLLSVSTLPEKLIDTIIHSRDAERLDRWIAELEEGDIYFLSIYHPQYPALLKEIYNPPIGIYLKGELPDDEINKVAVIGARRCSHYGASVAYQITKDLGKTNICIVSGMAAGIDSMAHKGIMDGDGKTIAVLGTGVDICYPKENTDLMERIIANGCVLSEYPPGTYAAPKRFPARNRIIAGLCKMVVVVEAGKKSGTLITADFALESGREVFVVPGNVTSSFSEGTNNLIKQGCPVITEGKDILIELGISYSNTEKQKFNQKISETLTDEEKAVYDLIVDQNPIGAEVLARQLKVSVQEVQYILSILEIAGHIKKIPQGGYIREVKI